MNTIIIDNITSLDAQTKKIRITVENKFLFPLEKIGIPQTYNLTFIIQDMEYIARYTIGSHDGKSRSGVLKIGTHPFVNLLQITEGSTLKISKNQDNKYSIVKILN